MKSMRPAESLGVRLRLSPATMSTNLIAAFHKHANSSNAKAAAPILGSQGSFIGIAVIDTMNELKVPWFGPRSAAWASSKTGRKPNYMFRVATNDREVAKFLVSLRR